MGGFRVTILAIQWDPSRQTYYYTMSAYNLQYGVELSDTLRLSEQELLERMRAFGIAPMEQSGTSHWVRLRPSRLGLY